ncbi:hypothetical protein DFH07DRAFT_963312 [Mycena maculata]|uniref:Uncharacterized protein n=1 Tax=Mycena maculata TaxID=230809 RepID=A0AAD7IL88_9AGAR|nr:hypothetical protein DFH07DRAFT_963312 [Mycena maculata]
MSLSESVKRPPGKHISPCVESPLNSSPRSTTSLLLTRGPRLPAAQGYRRSADLLRQITLLNEHLQTDYVVVLNLSAYIDINSAGTFIIMRNCATSNSGPRADATLLYVYRVLQKYGGDDAGLRAQLRQENGSTFDNMAAALRSKEQPTFEEVSRKQMDVALGHLRKLGRFDEELSGYKVGPQREVTVFAECPFEALAPVATLTPIVSKSRRPPAQGVGPNFAVSTARPTTYIVWGQVDAPDTPFTVTFTGLSEVLTFLGFRQRLFENGGYDLDALVFVMPTVRAQLARRYGETHVEMASESIIKHNGKDVRNPFALMMKELKKVGRFPEILKNLPA